MSSLPQSWHVVGINSPPKPVNPVSPLKRPRTLKLATRTSVNFNGPISQSQLTFTANQSEQRRTWNQRPTFDPSTIDHTPARSLATPKVTHQPGTGARASRLTLRPTKPTMPALTSNRAKSMSNGQELKSRLNEEMEILTLRKELSHLRDDNTALKGKMRRSDEDSAKKIKQLEKQLAVAKKDNSVIEKKKEATDETLGALRQKYQRLEVELRSKDLAMRKMQVSLRTPPRTNERLTSASRNPASSINNSNNSSLLNSGVSNARPMPTSRAANKTNTNSATAATSAEIMRLKDTNKRLMQENVKLSQQLKEKDQEIKTLKVTLSRNQKNTTSASSTSASNNSRFSSGHSKPESASSASVILASSPKKASSSNIKPPSALPRVSRTSLHRTTVKTTTVTSSTPSTNGKPIRKVKTTVVAKCTVNGIPQVTTPTSQTTVDKKIIKKLPTKSKEESLQDLQRKSAARKIQRSWRSHRERAKQGKDTNEIQDNSIQVLPIADEISITEDKELLEEDIEYLQSVLKGHLDRVEHAANFQTVEITEELTSNIETLHKNCFEQKDDNNETEEQVHINNSINNNLLD